MCQLVLSSPKAKKSCHDWSQEGVPVVAPGAAGMRYIPTLFCFRLPITQFSRFGHTVEIFKVSNLSFCPRFTGGCCIAATLTDAVISRLAFAAGMRIA